MKFLCEYFLTNMNPYSNLLVNVVNRKYEEISPPHVEQFCYITDNTYDKDQVIFIILFLILD